MKKKLTLWLAVALCAVTLTGCFRFERKVDTPAATDAAYIEKLNEIVALLDVKYVDGYDTSKLGDYLAQAAVSASIRAASSAEILFIDKTSLTSSRPQGDARG